LVAADVIAVVVRAQDGREREAHALDGRQHRRRLGGVDDRHLLRALVDDQIRVVVRQTRNRLDAHVTLPFLWPRARPTPSPTPPSASSLAPAPLRTARSAPPARARRSSI